MPTSAMGVKTVDLRTCLIVQINGEGFLTVISSMFGFPRATRFAYPLPAVFACDILPFKDVFVMKCRQPNFKLLLRDWFFAVYRESFWLCFRLFFLLCFSP